MNRDSCYKIGYILKPHGLKGQVTVIPEEFFPDNFSSMESIFIEINDRLVPYFIESANVKTDKAYVKFEDIDSSEKAAAIAKKSLFLPKSTRTPSGRGEFYDDEVVGFEVHDTKHGKLGLVTEVTSAGVNKLLSIAGDREVLIPINAPFIQSINKSKKKITVELPEGYLDI